MHRITRLVPTFAAVAVLANLIPTDAAHAHPGHATEIVSPSSGWHYFLQPEHAGVGLVMLVACGVAAFWVYRSWTARLTPAIVRRHG
jgi:hypothetical protein